MSVHSHRVVGRLASSAAREITASGCRVGMAALTLGLSALVVDSLSGGWMSVRDEGIVGLADNDRGATNGCDGHSGVRVQRSGRAHGPVAARYPETVGGGYGHRRDGRAFRVRERGGAGRRRQSDPRPRRIRRAEQGDARWLAQEAAQFRPDPGDGYAAVPRLRGVSRDGVHASSAARSNATSSG